MTYLRLIPYIVILIFIIFIGYKEFDSYKSSSELKSQIISLQKQIKDSDQKQYDQTIKMIREYSILQDQRMKEMTDEITKINTTVSHNTTIVTSLHDTTKTVDSNLNTYSDATKDAYIRSINDQFRECTNSIVEVAKQSDENHSAALTYYNMLVDLHNTFIESQKESDK